MRTIIELTDAQVAALTAYCEREQVSCAEAVRRAVDRMVDAECAKADARVAAIRAAIGIWREDSRDGRAIVDELRSEWAGRP